MSRYAPSHMVATESRLLRRSCESLLGIAAGLMADGALNDAEILFLSTWLSENQGLAESWPGEVIYRRVRGVLSDGVVTSEERLHLEETLTQLIGGSFVEDGCVPAGATMLPIDCAAAVSILGNSFCFTGEFLSGTRAWCEQRVKFLGGRVVSVTMALDYLVIGELASRDWKYSSHGRKIETALSNRTRGSSVQIIGEQQWLLALNASAGGGS